MRKKIIFTGGTGFIGSNLIKILLKENYEVVNLTISPDRYKSHNANLRYVKWDRQTEKDWITEAEGAYAIINLAGDNIATGKWTDEKKKSILESRLLAGNAVLKAIERTNKKPQILIQASAVGFYGNKGEEILDENSEPDQSFLSKVCQSWEQSTESALKYNVRRAVIRTAVVLDANGGFLTKILKTFNLFAGGHPGNGRQWMSWIHLQDEIQAIKFILENPDLDGIFNLAAPDPVRAKGFYKELGRIINRPSWFPQPEFALKAILGLMADELILTSQRVLPKKLIKAGFNFQYPSYKDALNNLFGR